LRYLRRAQFRALETYWYLRLVLNTPRIGDLYTLLFPVSEAPRPTRSHGSDFSGDRRADCGRGSGYRAAAPPDRQRVRPQHGLESLRESLALDYPSYILALAMGAGKTILMGSIVATEFALALEYPDGPFVENALIFAPGKTILGALRELADIPMSVSCRRASTSPSLRA
jgi:type III restriction enzyme